MALFKTRPFGSKILSRSDPIMLVGQVGEEEKSLLTPSQFSEQQIEKEFFEARESGDQERLEKAWAEYKKLWKQDGIFSD